MQSKVYRLYRIDGTSDQIRTSQKLAQGMNYTFSVLGEVIQAEYLGADGLKEVKVVNTTTIDRFVIGGQILFVCLGIASLVWAVTVAVPPDPSVERAAATLTANPTIGPGRVAFRGCSSGDLYRFPVNDKAGKSVGYVCRGGDYPFSAGRGATPRFN
jgi:hypothetical protein